MLSWRALSAIASIWLVALPGVSNASANAKPPHSGTNQSEIPPPDNPVKRTSPLEIITQQAVVRMATANASPEMTGAGPFPAKMEVDLALPNATIYRPANLGQLGRRKLGVMIWGNGGCSNDGASARMQLAEVASHGYLVIAPGKPLTGPFTLPGGQVPKPMTTTVQELRELLDWALAENVRHGSPYFQRVDTTSVSAGGHSCGGIQAILLGADPRIKTVIVHNSGAVSVLPDNPPLINHKERLAGLRRSVLFVSGGETDILWQVTNDAFAGVGNIPAAMVSANVGHDGTFFQPHGGRAAQIAVDWLEWRLRGSTDAARSFTGKQCKLCSDPEWTIRKKGFR